MTAISTHPSYRRPTIREALCEVHFERAAPWDVDLFPKFAEAIRPDFPIFEPIVAIGVELSFGPGVFGHRVAAPRQIMRFRNDARSGRSVQLAEGLFTINFLPPYPGWEAMKAEIQRLWALASGTVNPTQIPGFGLRYINLIPARSDEPAAAWLQPSRYLPEAVLAGDPATLRAAWKPDASCAVELGLTRGTMSAPGQPGETGIILDTKCVWVEPGSGPAIVESNLDRLHDEVWEIFSSARSRRLEDYLEGTNDASHSGN